MAKSKPQVYYPLMLDPVTGASRSMTQEEYSVLQKEAKALARKENAVNAPPKVETVFFRVYKTNWSALVRSKELTFSQIGLFSALMAFADWGTNRIIDIDTKEILSIRALAALFDMDRKHLSDGLHVLEEKGLVALQQRGSNTYILINPHVMWFGRFMTNKIEHEVAFSDVKYRPVVFVDYQAPRPT